MSQQYGNAQAYDEQYESREGNQYSLGRNPYLADYAQQRRAQQRNKAEYAEPIIFRRPGRQGGGTAPRRAEESAARRRPVQGEEPVMRRRPVQGEEPVMRRCPVRVEEPVTRRHPAQAEEPITRRRQAQVQEPITRRRQAAQVQEPITRRRPVQAEEPMTRRHPVRAEESIMQRRLVRANQTTRKRSKKRIFMQRLAISLWVMCILLLGAVFVMRNHAKSVAANNSGQSVPKEEQGEVPGTKPAEVFVQGIPQEKFAQHPDWTEDFLTPNEYSRPGDSLAAADVSSIFVHYTANPGTSAKQNRSYFEQQKDLHQSSVSAHFIIGYEGEVLQCVPLDEIAYAVIGRNYDSISIECCYLEKDGSFTQETYDSLVELLAWLIDAYDLSSEDIQRHYDSSGKKCPLYYVNNPEAWVQLKKDVDNF